TVDVSITVNPINDAPVFDTPAHVDITQIEDASKLGDGHAFKIDDKVKYTVKVDEEEVQKYFFNDDVDDRSKSDDDSFWGIAIVGGINTAQGTWYYSVNDGATWTEILASDVSSTGKTLALYKGALLRFDSAKDWNGDVDDLQWKLVEIESTKAEIDHPTKGEPDLVTWDTKNASVDVGEGKTGGTTHISADTGVFDITVTPANDAPTGNADYDLGDYSEDDESTYAYAKVQAMFGDAFHDGSKQYEEGELVGGDGDEWMDQADAFAGIIITSTETDAAKGAWQWTDKDPAAAGFDPETDWHNIPTDVREAEGFVIGKDCYIRFKPHENWNGTPEQLKGYLYEADDSNETGTGGDETNPDRWVNGSRPNVEPANRGENFVPGKATNETRVSDSLSSVSVEVLPVNDRPEFPEDTPVVISKTTVEDQPSAAFKVADEAEDLFNDPDDAYGAEHGGAAAGTFWGIAVVSTPDAKYGHWQYKAPGDADWTTIYGADEEGHENDGVDAEHALTLKGDAELRFNPATDAFTMTGDDGLALGWCLVESRNDLTTGGEIDATTDTVASDPAKASTFTMSIDPRNDAPSGNADATLGNITEDIASDKNPGKTVTELFAGNFSDEWAGAKADGKGDKFNEHEDYLDTFAGIIITGNAATASQGVWQYSADGSSWTDIAGVSETAGLVIGKDCSIRFVPAENWNGTPGGLEGYVFETGSAEVYGLTADWATGISVDATVRGEAMVGEHESCISGTLSTLTVTVDPVNDAPQPKEPSVVMPTIDEDPEDNDGKTVDELFGPVFSDPNDKGQEDELAGVIVTDVPEGKAETEGTWQYKDSDGEWQDIEEGHFIGADTEIRFNPAPDYNGEPEGITVRLVEDEKGEVPYETGDKVDLETLEVGGTTIVSEGTVDVSITVNPINDAPVFNGDGKVELEQIEDVSALGNGHAFKIGDKVEGFFKDDADQVADGSTKDNFWGIAIVGGLNPAQGTWFYSINDGASWTPIVESEVRSDGKTLALSKDVMLRFDSAEDWNGDVDELQWKLIEIETVKAEEDHPTKGRPNLVTADTKSASLDVGEGKTGGTTHISAENGVFAIEVTPTNDAPTGHADYDMGEIDEDVKDEDNPGKTVQAMFGGVYDDTADDDMGEGDAFAGIVITYNNVDAATQGSWQWKAPGDAGWSNIPLDVSEANGFVIGKDCSIRFKPVEDWNGTPEQLKGYIYETDDNNETGTGGTGESAWKSGTSGVNVDADHRGEAYVYADSTHETRVSNELSTISIKVKSVNDRPEFIGGETDIGKTTIEDQASASFRISAEAERLFSDPHDKPASEHGGAAAGTFWGIAVTSTPDAKYGHWEYKAPGETSQWTPITSASATSALLLKGDVEMRFVPATDAFTVSGDANVSLGWRLVETSETVTHSTGARTDTTKDDTTSATDKNFNISIDKRNDAPYGWANKDMGHIAEDIGDDAVKNPGQTVQALFSANFSDTWAGAKTDGKGDFFNTHSDEDQFGGIIIT
ncbi:MAG: hypothetical protein HUK26_07650, partial [Duodenibacillus sp.]|nr:hypothetical protein [Duodenibacillus sp.]